jgi:tetratricopeptide (TPR) repeat protein
VRFGSTLAVLGLVLATGASLFLPARLTSAQEVNCANEFRSGKLYFAQKINRKAVDHFAVSVKACPDKAEYRARYAMALAQFGEDKLAIVEATGDVAGNKADVDTVLDLYKLAGSEFDASLKVDPSKGNVKFVKENRRHFWVNRYNEGIKLSKEEKHDAAVVEFKLARYVDPTEIKPYAQGAIELFNQGNKSEASALIREGMVIAPNDTTLAGLLIKFGADEARDLVKKAEDPATPPEEAVLLCARADSLYTAKLKTNDKDAYTFFDRGLGRLTWAATLASKDSAQSVGIYGKAAEDFHKAGELTPASTDSAFYQSALYNEIQASMNAGNVSKAVDMVKEYMNYDCKDGGMWKTYAQALYLNKDKQGAVALIISNSMSRGNEVALADAIKNAQEDAKKALSERGNPTHVYAYTEDMGGKSMSIESWIWCNKKKSNVYYLGKDNGEVGW